ncbi:MAG: acyl-CoA dehydrogenase family protein [Kiritimatiellia bacterium]
MSDERLVIDTSGMSEGKRQALEMAELSRDAFTQPSFVASVFMGRFPFHLVHPAHTPPDPEGRGAAFLEKLEAFLREKVDPDAIDRDGEIPREVLDGLAALGAFGIKVPREYGGLGLTQTDYCRAALLLGSHCASTTALLSAHQSIGVPQPLLLFGTDDQKRRYLPRTAGGEISAFALTEAAVGSDPAQMATRADPEPGGTHFLLNGEKLWCTNGTRAGLMVVMARTPPKTVDGRERSQVTAFLVETSWPGVEVVRRCRFMGLKALYNGVIRFTNVRVPRENILLAEGKGLKVALSTLNTGRLTLPAGCAGAMKRCLAILRDWCSTRVQWGAPIGRHAAIADKLARIATDTLATEAMTMHTAALVDRHAGEIRLEAAMCKMFGSEAAWRCVDETLQIRGGRGYETADSLAARGEKPIAIERMLRDAKINMIFEGSSEIMRLFIAREALDPHLRTGADVLNPKLPAGVRLKAALKAALFYAPWYLGLWMPREWGLDTRGLDRRLVPHVRRAARLSRRLARSMFHAMLRHGPRLEREQVLLGHLVDIGSHIFAIAAVCARARALRETEGVPAVTLAVHACLDLEHRADRSFREIARHHRPSSYQTARELLAGDYRWLERGAVEENRG